MAERPALVAADGVTPLRRALTREIAAPSLMSARQIITGHPADGLEPEQLAMLLRGAEDGDPTSYLELAEQMEERDLHYLSVLGTRKRQVSQLPITVEAASDAPIDQAKAQMIRDWLRRDTLEGELFDMLDAVGKGLSFIEIVWDTRRRPWLPAKLIWRDPRWFEPDRIDGTFFRLRGQGLPTALQPFKFIQHVHPAKSGLPIRSGLARPVAWAYLFKSFGLKDWVAFAEIFGFPIRVGKYGAGASGDDIRVLLRAVSQISRDAAAVIPDSMTLDFINGQTTGGGDLYARLCEYLDKQISKAVLGQTATTDSQGGGLGGSGKEHNDVRGDIERADAKLVAATLNRDVVVPIIDFNFGRPSDGPLLYPMIKIGREDEVDIEAEMKAIGDFVDRGGRVAISVVRDKLRLPDPAPKEALLQPISKAAPATETPLPGLPGGGSPGGPQNGLFPGLQAPSGPNPQLATAIALLAPLIASYGKVQPATAATLPAGAGMPAPRQSGDDIDELVQLMADEGWEAVLGPMVDPLIEAMTGATSYEDAQALLATTLARMDSTALAERLEKAAFAIRAAGLTGADGTLPGTPAV